MRPEQQGRITVFLCPPVCPPRSDQWVQNGSSSDFKY